MLVGGTPLDILCWRSCLWSFILFWQKKMCIPNASRLCFGPSLWSCQQQQTLDADTLARFSNSKPTQHVQTFLRGLAATPTSICTLSCASFVHLLEQSKTSHHISFCFWPLWLLVDA